MKFQCSKGHKWETRPYVIIAGRWCAKSPLRKTLEDAQKLAKEKNGLCLSKEYKNNHTKMLWKCRSCNPEVKRVIEEIEGIKLKERGEK